MAERKPVGVRRNREGQAIGRVSQLLDDHFTPDTTAWLDVGGFEPARLYVADLRALVAMAKRCEELERRSERRSERRLGGGSSQ